MPISKGDMADWAKSFDQLNEVLNDGLRLLQDADAGAIIDAVTNMESDAVVFTLLIGFTPLVFVLILGWICRASIPEKELNFLKDLYRSTNGPCWNRNDGWDRLDDYLFDANSLYGVTVRKGHVVKLDLYKNNLQGKFMKIRYSQWYWA